MAANAQALFLQEPDWRGNRTIRLLAGPGDAAVRLRFRKRHERTRP